MTKLRATLVLSCVALVTLVLAPVQILGLVFDWRIRRYLPRYWHRIACALLGVRVNIRGTPDPRRPLMLASNHASWIDILALSSIADVVFIAKTEVATWPIFGVLAKLQKSVFIVREQKRRTGEQVNDIAARMAAGEIVVLFPEGTTSDGNRLLEVKSSLFGAATAALPLAPEGKVFIQPVAIAYTKVQGMPMGRYHRPIAGWPGTVELVPHLMGLIEAGAIDVDICFGESIVCDSTTSRKVMAAEVERQIRAMLSERLLGRVR